MIQLEGDRQITLPLESVSTSLRDPQFLIQIIPDVHEVKAVSEQAAELILRPGFSFIRGTLTVNLHVVEASASDVIQYQLTSKGIGTTSETEAVLTLKETDTGTGIHWVLTVQKLGGLLKAVPKGLIRGAAEKVVNDAWNRIDETLSNNETTS